MTHSQFKKEICIINRSLGFLNILLRILFGRVKNLEKGNDIPVQGKKNIWKQRGHKKIFIFISFKRDKRKFKHITY